MSNYKDFEEQASRLYDAIIGKRRTRALPFSSDNLWNEAWKLRKNNKITDFIFDEIVNVTYNLDNQSLNWSDEQLNEKRKQLGSLILNIENGNASGNVEQTSLGPLLEKLSMRSKEAVVDSDSFSKLKKYMHVERPIQSELEGKINKLFDKKKGIIFLVGNVGDGKSHLLAYMKDKYVNRFENEQIKIINDATESDSPSHTAVETLVNNLEQYNDQNINFGNQRLIIAINLGVITNLLNKLKELGEFSELVTYLEKSGISNGVVKSHQHKIFDNVSFFNLKTFDVRDGKIESSFFSAMFNKVFSKDEDNLFYQAYLDDKKNHRTQAFHVNYELMLDNEIKDSIIYLLIRSQIEYKEIISVRTLMNFIYDILISNREKINYDSYLPFLIFDNAETSPLLKTISLMDPTNNQSRKVDELSTTLYHTSDIFNLIKKLFKDDYKKFQPMFDKFRNKKEDSKYFQMLVNTIFRVKFLINARTSVLNNKEFQEYIEILQEVTDKHRSISLFELIDKSVRLWNGQVSKEQYVITARTKNSTSIAVELELEPVLWEVNNFNIIVEIENHNAISGKEIQRVEIDYRTYALLCKVVQGYLLKKEDIQTVVKFDEFVSLITRSTRGERINVLYNPNLNQEFELKRTYDKSTLRQLGD